MHCINRYISLDGNRMCCWHLENCTSKAGYFLVACYATDNVKNVVVLARGYYSKLDKERGYSLSETARGTPNFVWEKNVNS
jgi:hypothetical protein